jgi:hypothetical protein
MKNRNKDKGVNHYTILIKIIFSKNNFKSIKMVGYILLVIFFKKIAKKNTVFTHRVLYINLVKISMTKGLVRN